MNVDVARAGVTMDIQRVRKLPLPGEVLVNEGEQVQPADVIAMGSIIGKILMLDIASGLGVDIQGAKDALVRQVGDNLNNGDVLAQISGAFPRLVRAPLTGRFAAFHQGKAVFEVERETILVRAGLMGVVQSVIPEYGANISTRGLLIQGMWGNGRIGSGSLHIAQETWSDSQNESEPDDGGGGQVLAVGTCMGADAFAWLMVQEPAGIIFGSLAPGLVEEAASLPIPIIVVQGFGPCQADFSLYGWFETHAGKTACLDASKTDRMTGARPEVIIPCDEEADADALGLHAELREGLKVRLFSGRALGAVGEVNALPEGLSLFESGLMLPAAIVQLENGEKIAVPQQNLVILG